MNFKGKDNGKNGLNGYYFIGMTSLVTVQLLDRFATLPDFIHGFGIGLSLVMLFASILHTTGKLQKIKALKAKLFTH